MSTLKSVHEDSHLSSSKQQDLYLTLAPRGLESFVITNIRSQLTTNGYSCWISEIGPSPLTQLHGALSVTKTKENGCAPTTSNAPVDEIAARIEYNKYKKRVKKRKKESQLKSKAAAASEPPSEAFSFDSYMSEVDLLRVTGSVDVSEIGCHTSIGYHSIQHKVQRILSVPGTLEGVVLVSFQTDAPPLFVASMSGMGCGPLLALITSSCLQMPTSDDTKSNCPNIVEEKVFDYNQSIDQARSAIESFFVNNKGSYCRQFQRALHLWQRHREDVWYAPNSIYGDYHGKNTTDDKQEKPAAAYNTIYYRLSCTRSHSKKYSHQREELVPTLGDWVIPGDLQCGFHLRPTTIIDSHSSSPKEPTKWVVNLKDYDIEIVSMVHYGCLTVAFPLRPYQLWQTKGYRSNIIPSDGSGVFGRLGPKKSLGRFICLRPSTAGKHHLVP